MCFNIDFLTADIEWDALENFQQSIKLVLPLRPTVSAIGSIHPKCQKEQQSLLRDWERMVTCVIFNNQFVALDANIDIIIIISALFVINSIFITVE